LLFLILPYQIFRKYKFNIIIVENGLELMKKLKLKLLAITVATTVLVTLLSTSALAAWQESGGDWYYLNDSGETKTGWVKDNGII
jgi:hypothetical protein